MPEVWLDKAGPKLGSYGKDGWPIDFKRLSSLVMPLMKPDTGFIDNKDPNTVKAVNLDSDVKDPFS